MEKFFQKNIWKKVHATDSVFLLIALVDPYCSLDFGSGYNRQLLTAEKLQIKTKKKTSKLPESESNNRPTQLTTC